MTTKELKNKIIRCYEENERKIFDLIINFEGEIRNDEIEACIDGAISNIKELTNSLIDDSIIKIQKAHWKEVINDVIDRLRDFIATKEEREDRKND